MKKLLLLIGILFLGLMFTSCTVVDDSEDDKNVSVIMPTGTPALALATYVEEVQTNNTAQVEIVAGSDPLLAAFSNKSHDIIVAPVNLGAKMYQTYGDYILYKTFVWGNLYLASKNQISSIADLNDKTVVVFGQNSTPDIVFKAILKNHPELNVTLTYASDVSEANTMLVSNQAEIIVSAEPSLSKLKTKFDLSIIDLQSVWQEMTGNASYPQAGIFVKREEVSKKYMQNALTKMKESITSAISNPEQTANAAVNIHTSFASLGVDTLKAAIPNCHYQLLESDKEAVNYYLQMMIDLGFGKQMGETLPNDEFFY